MCIVSFIFGLLSLPVINGCCFHHEVSKIFILFTKGTIIASYLAKTKACCIGIYIRNSSKILHNTFLQLFGHSG